MFINYLTVALRNLLRYKGYSAINVLGLAIGIACCVLIMLYVQDELSYDQHHEKNDRIYRLAESAVVAGRSIEAAVTPPPWAPVLAEDYPEIEQITRIKPPNSRWLIRYQANRFYEKNFVFADSSVFDIFTIPSSRATQDQPWPNPIPWCCQSPWWTSTSAMITRSAK